MHSLAVVGSGRLRKEAIASPIVLKTSLRSSWTEINMQTTLTRLQAITTRQMGMLTKTRQCSEILSARHDSTRGVPCSVSNPPGGQSVLLLQLLRGQWLMSTGSRSCDMV